MIRDPEKGSTVKRVERKGVKDDGGGFGKVKGLISMLMMQFLEEGDKDQWRKGSGKEEGGGEGLGRTMTRSTDVVSYHV